MNRAARIRASNELIRQALKMPEGTVILNINAVNQWFKGGKDFEFLVTHPDLNEVAHGAVPPELSPVVHYEVEKYTWDWNQKRELDEDLRGDPVVEDNEFDEPDDSNKEMKDE